MMAACENYQKRFKHLNSVSMCVCVCAPCTLCKQRVVVVIVIICTYTRCIWLNTIPKSTKMKMRSWKNFRPITFFVVTGFFFLSSFAPIFPIISLFVSHLVCHRTSRCRRLPRHRHAAKQASINGVFYFRWANIKFPFCKPRPSVCRSFNAPTSVRCAPNVQLQFMRNCEWNVTLSALVLARWTYGVPNLFNRWAHTTYMDEWTLLPNKWNQFRRTHTHTQIPFFMYRLDAWAYGTWLAVGEISTEHICKRKNI